MLIKTHTLANVILYISFQVDILRNFSFSPDNETLYPHVEFPHISASVFQMSRFNESFHRHLK
jgi:hypothetical protein